MEVEGSGHQAGGQRYGPVQAARVVCCPPRRTEVLGTKEEEEKAPEKSLGGDFKDKQRCKFSEEKMVLLNRKVGGNSVVNKP